MQRANPVAQTGEEEHWSARLIWMGVSMVGFLIFWEVLALLMANPRYLPTPTAVFADMGAEVANGTMVYHTAVTLARVIAAFTLAMLIGSAIGILMGRLPRIDKFFDAWLILFLNLPALVTIILCYIWIPLPELAAIAAVTINKVPNVAVTVREGARSLSRDLAEMAIMYRFGRWRTLRHVILPQLAPYFLASARTGLSLVWKIVLVVEALGQSEGVGFQLYNYYQNFQVSMILAYALAFIAVVQVIEFGIMQPIARRMSKWRR